MPKTLRDLSRSVEERSRAEGTAAEAELVAFRTQARIARILSERRLEQGLTQQQLATLSGIPQSEISKIENARANPTVATLAALARPLGLEITASEVAPAAELQDLDEREPLAQMDLQLERAPRAHKS